MSAGIRVFDLWAPPGGPWSPWVKPILFAEIAGRGLKAPAASIPEPQAQQALPADGRGPAAWVVDLTGGAALEEWARSLAPLGYRPIPLYNAAPGPRPPAIAAGIGPDTTAAAPSPALVDVWSIIEAMLRTTPVLESLALPLDAPPAFLLDAGRRTGSGPASPGRFDNRSISFPTDFPSASLLESRGHGRVVLVQADRSPPQPDLAHTLRRWQEAGIEILRRALDSPGPPEPIVVERPSRFRSLWYGCLASLGLRRHPLGGFGGEVPQPSSG